MKDRLKYLRISLLNNCNLNCYYCRPHQDSNNHQPLADYNNFTNSIKILHELGVNKIRFSGGEPTLYKELSELIRYTKNLNNDIYTGITTNALLLSKQSRLLTKVGLDSVNISIDTLSREKFNEITGSDSFSNVVDGIKSAIDCFPSVKLNTVVIRNVNDTEVHQLVQFADELKIDIRFIEYMPTDHNSQNRSEYISGDEIKKRLPYTFTPCQTDKHAAARYYSSPELSIKVGFINPVSHSFCSLCNRIRLTSDGRLYGCLFSSSSFNLFDALKDGYDAAVNEIKSLMDNKKYSGCSIIDSQNPHYPSFLNMGG